MEDPLPTAVTGGALFSRDRRYRYRLWRSWDPDGARVAFVMLNPSTADDRRDDPTIRRCVGFARSWGFGSLDVVNLFGYRATFPADLVRAPDPVGQENARHVRAALRGADLVVLAWGRRATDSVLLSLPRAHCLGLTRTGQPRHPLYVRGETRPVSVRDAQRSAA